MNINQFLQWCQTFTPESPFDIEFQKPLIMGVLNITPDSFSDAGQFSKVDDAFDQARLMVEQGADLIDIGGESSRPGAQPVSLDEELSRVVPVIEHIRQASDICISIDTYKATVMQEAVAAGASWINDINALQSKGALETAARLGVPVCLMHMKGNPKSMQNEPYYATSVVDEVSDFFEQRIDACIQAGILRERLILDPGFGFGKSVEHNLQLLKQLSVFLKHGRPILLGASRKSTIGAVINKSITQRLVGSITTSVYAILQGVTIIRTHDVDESRQAMEMLSAIVDQP